MADVGSTGTSDPHGLLSCVLGAYPRVATMSKGHEWYFGVGVEEYGPGLDVSWMGGFKVEEEREGRTVIGRTSL